MLETVETMVNKEVEGDDEEDPEELIEDLARVFANEAARRFDKDKKRVTSNSQKAAKKSMPQPSTSRTTGSQSVPNPTSANRLEPAYHFESPCENSALVTQVWNKTLDATIMISPQELLAVSTDM
jgi:nucleotidyltransferase/DNA polymerase involved in DNA repair